jgi:SEC-C motif-containing protein
MPSAACPCGSGQFYAQCCQLYLSGEATPQAPEALMRSRYTAYVKADIDYIEKTMGPPASIGFDRVDAKRWAQKVKWLGLNVLGATAQGDQGTVEFVARYKINGKAQRMHENSLFKRIHDQWVYVDVL